MDQEDGAHDLDQQLPAHVHPGAADEGAAAHDQEAVRGRSYTQTYLI